MQMLMTLTVDDHTIKLRPDTDVPETDIGNGPTSGQYRDVERWLKDANGRGWYLSGTGGSDARYQDLDRCVAHIAKHIACFHRNGKIHIEWIGWRFKETGWFGGTVIDMSVTVQSKLFLALSKNNVTPAVTYAYQDKK